MPRPRKELVSVEDTPYYHVGSRCVRRTFLCGFDHVTQTSYEHRRQWIEDRIRLLSSLFAIDVCAYAIMNNHYHIVVKLVPDQSREWAENDVMRRWLCLFKGTLLVQKFDAGEKLSPSERQSVTNTLAVYRKRLASLSWFMKCLNEPIARRGNKEDGCTGHFWESRFKSQALRNEPSLITCMAYVDLNPIRARIAKTPERSDYTSIKERIAPTFNLEKAVKKQLIAGGFRRFELALKPLLRFAESRTDQDETVIPIQYLDYLELVDWTGRSVVKGKTGKIEPNLALILDRLQITPDVWMAHSTHFEDHNRGSSYLKRSNE